MGLLAGACSEDNPNYVSHGVTDAAVIVPGADLAGVPPRDFAVIPDLTFFPDLAVNMGPSVDVAEDPAGWEAGESLDDNIVPCNPMTHGTVKLSGDATRFKVGQRSVRVDYGPDVSSYFQAAYPKTRDGGWDLRARTGVDLFVDGQQPTMPAGWGGWSPNAPTIVLCSAGGYRRLDPQANPLPRAQGTWPELKVPLAGGVGWNVMQSGNFDLSKVNSIEVHTDPLRNGIPGTCSMWIDGLRFY